MQHLLVVSNFTFAKQDCATLILLSDIQTRSLYLQGARLVDRLQARAAGHVGAAARERIELRRGEGGQQDGLPHVARAAGQDRRPHAHDVRAVLRLGQPVQRLEHCARPHSLLSNSYRNHCTCKLHVHVCQHLLHHTLVAAEPHAQCMEMCVSDTAEY